MRSKKSGYVLGLIFSGVAAIVVTVAAVIYLQAELVRCFMSLGCTDGSPGLVLLLLLGVYLLIAAGVAAVATRVFNTRPAVAFFLNVAPLVAILAFAFLRMQYIDYANARNRSHALQNAVDDAPAIHLGQPYVKMVDEDGGGVTLFMHVPFNVDKTVQAHSLNILVVSNDASPSVRYSSTRECNSGFGLPTHGFHIVDREFTEPPMPRYVSGRKIVSPQLQPGIQYYLLRELRFGYSLCRVSDYSDFDPKQLSVAVDVSLAKEPL